MKLGSGCSIPVQPRSRSVATKRPCGPTAPGRILQQGRVTRSQLWTVPLKTAEAAPVQPLDPRHPGRLSRAVLGPGRAPSKSWNLASHGQVRGASRTAPARSCQAYPLDEGGRKETRKRLLVTPRPEIRGEPPKRYCSMPANKND